MISVYVLSAPGRDETWERCKASIETSDIGTNYVRSLQAPGVAPRAHWTATFELMAQADTPLVLLLEDDCLVNRHILENLRGWPWPAHKDFGAGWIYNPGGYCGGSDCWYGSQPDWYGTVAVLYWRRDVLGLMDRANSWMDSKGSRAWDCAAAWAVWWSKLKIRVHGPPLVEHQHQAPSLLDHQHSWSFGTTRGTFKEHWRRPPGPPVELREPDRCAVPRGGAELAPEPSRAPAGAARAQPARAAPQGMPLPPAPERQYRRRGSIR